MKNNTNKILLIGIVIAILLFLQQCNRSTNLNDDLKIANMNKIALSDSITTYKSKNKTLVYEKSTLIASKKELKELNSDLYEEVKDLKKKPKIIFKERIVIQRDTIPLETKIIKYPDGSIGLNWTHDTLYNEGNFQKLYGETKFKIDTTGIIYDINTKLNINELGLSFVTGLTKGKDNYEIFIKSDYPGFKVTNIEGAIIDKSMITSNESSWVIGPSIGYGFVLSDGVVRYGPTIGFNVTWNMNKKVKKIFRPFGL